MEFSGLFHHLRYIAVFSRPTLTLTLTLSRLLTPRRDLKRPLTLRILSLKPAQKFIHYETIPSAS